jgi:hypothetical protein
MKVPCSTNGILIKNLLDEHLQVFILHLSKYRDKESHLT